MAEELCLTGLRAFVKEKALARELQALGAEGVLAVRKRPREPFAFVRFESAAARERFLAAFPAELPLPSGRARVRAVERSPGWTRAARPARPQAEAPDLPLIERVCPLHALPYAEQLRVKEARCHAQFHALRARLLARNAGPPPRQGWLRAVPAGLLAPIVGAAEPAAHTRNKCEFTVSANEQPGELHIGFVRRVDRARNVFVVELPADLPIVSAGVFRAVQALRRALAALLDAAGERRAALGPYDYSARSGCLRNVVVRESSLTGQLAVKVVWCTAELLPAEKEALAAALRAACAELGPALVCLVAEECAGAANAVPNDRAAETLLLGARACLLESAAGHPFAVPVSGFFQAHPRLADGLYRRVAELLRLDGETVLLDICAGAGAIGLSVGGAARAVYFVEAERASAELIAVNAQLGEFARAAGAAVEPARLLDAFFAAREGLPAPAVHVFARRIEDCVQELAAAVAGRGLRTVAVVDPPRAGLHPSVAQALRTFKGLDELVYVSCDFAQASDNLARLCDEERKGCRGPPFSPVLLAPMDLFPHTRHCETLIHLKRLYE